MKSNSPFVGAELAIKTGLAGYKVGEIGIHTYPRTFGSGSSVGLKNILLTIQPYISKIHLDFITSKEYLYEIINKFNMINVKKYVLITIH